MNHSETMEDSQTLKSLTANFAASGWTNIGFIGKGKKRFDRMGK